MTQRSVTYLKGKFENGDIPSQSDYGDVFDSFLSLESSAAQTLSGSIVLTGVDATRVSATTVSADTVITSALRATRIDANSVSAATVSANTVITSALRAIRIDANSVSAATVSAHEVYASAIHLTGNIHYGYVTTTAAGASQASAFTTGYDMSFLYVTDPAERSVKIEEHRSGIIQYIHTDATAVTALYVYPQNGCNFIGTAANAPQLLAAGATMQVLHVNASAYSFVRY